jgi:hypothetical protein
MGAIGCNNTQPIPFNVNSPGVVNTASNEVGEAPADKGDLNLRYRPRNPRTSPIADFSVPSEQNLEELVAELNQRVKLPVDLYVSFEDCEEPDAFYDPESHQVTMCYQLLDDYVNLFAGYTKDSARLRTLVKSATVSTFFHEFGHALVDLWHIPITGRAEDAVDQLATFVLIESIEDGDKMALDGALSFKLYADLSKGEPKVYWDDHSLDEQRFYDTLCLVYGHNGLRHQNLVKKGDLPAERATHCAEEYKTLRDAWRALLAPYLKKTDTPRAKMRVR